MATILRRNLISVTEGPVTLLDACYHSRHADRVILYFSKTTEIDQVHVNPPWRVVERASVDGAWTLHLEQGGMRPYRWSCLVRIMRWSLPYSDITQHLDQVGKIYAVYDPYIEQDRLHIERIQHPNLVPLKAIGLGHKSAMVLRRMDQLKPIMSGAIKGTLTQSEFYQRNRDRKNVLVYRRNIEEYLTERGKEHRVAIFRRAFKLRLAAREA